MPEITIQVIHGDDPFSDPSLSIESTSTVAELKEAIAAWWNISTDEQLLVYYKQPLQDNNTLESYHIGDDSKVQLGKFILLCTDFSMQGFSLMPIPQLYNCLA